jgi:hypothetical protein
MMELVENPKHSVLKMPVLSIYPKHGNPEEREHLNKNGLSKRWTFRPQGTNVVDNHENGHEQQSLETKSFCASLVNRDF